MKRGAVDHPKALALADLLGLPKVYVVGVLETMWQFTARFAPQGNIGKFSDEAIAQWMQWPDDPRKLIASLEHSGWLDSHPKHRLLVHGWAEHADETTKKALRREGLWFVEKSGHKSGHDRDKIRTQVRTQSRQNPDTVEPALPCLALPCPALPEPDFKTPLSLSSPPAAEVPAKSPTRRERRCPSDWAPTQVHATLAAELGVDLQAQLDLFRDHEFAMPHSDWSAAFKNWLRRAREYAGQTKPRQTPSDHIEASIDEFFARQPRESMAPKSGGLVVLK